MDNINKMKDLIKIINKHNYNYYVLDNPTIADREYDKIYDELVNLEKLTGVTFPDSPTKQVGDRVLEGFTKHKHISKLYSLGKVNSLSELETWIDDVEKNYGKQEYTLEYKFDGLQMTITYENGKFVSAATRGNGIIGEDVTNQVLTIKNIPLYINYKGKLVVQGEAMMRLSVLDEYNKTALEPLKNARNAAAGAIRNLDPKVTGSRNLDMFFYGVVYIDNNNFSSHIEIMNFLKDNGFPVYDYMKVLNNKNDIFKAIEEIDKSKKNLDILIDGAVLKINDVSIRKELGYTAKFPKWAIAYKFEAQELTSKLKKVVWQVGRTGKLTPIGEIEPIELAGATVKRATLNNYGDIERKGVKINSSVFVRRSNEVIPEILKVAEIFDDCVEIEKPKYCPSCGSLLHEIGANLFCLNSDNCPAQIDNRLTHYCSRNAMNIVGLSEKTIKQLRVELGVKKISDLYYLTKEQLKTLESFKDKKSENIIKNIEKSKNPNFSNFIYALGINGVGDKTAKDLAKKFNTLTDLMNASIDEINKVDDIGEVISESIYSFFHNEKQLNLINDLTNIGIKINYQNNNIKFNENFSNKTIVLTGDLDNYTRTELTNLLESYNSKVTTSVSSKTDLVIVGKNAGSKLLKAQKLNIKIMYEDELLKKIN